ncbi:surface-adhesin E family protein [Acinetobacter variabilis]|uniref:Surface-adhesin protein E-like domain-containing protein n=1 Tax=Acinetobacter variabilis TaxID=70346 RepID=N8WU75_9GAMM|nr:surface-adhesin E family protein [Acinetobacter variabilis]ENV00439.1 hypothetical protein F969_00569 [Acinetobacter variabilis]
MNKTLVAALFLALGSTTITNAADWVELSSDSNTTVSVDADRIAYANKALDQRNAWVKVKYNRPDGIYKAGDYTLTSQVVDCKKTRFNISATIGYSASGQYKGQDNKPSGWLEIPPGTIFEYVADAICSYPHI